MEERTDAVVLGMGPGGEAVAGQLAEAGWDVVGVDSTLLGGECPYWGCVPTKMMVRSADLLAEGRRIPGMGGTSTVVPDWAPVARRVRDEATDDWDDRVAVERFEGKGGRFVRGSGRLVGPDRVAVGDRLFVAERAVVVATGARSWAPPVPGLDAVPYWTNREVVEAAEVPDSLLVLGGGAVGVELGQVLARFGSEVTIVEVADRLLHAEEPEAGDLLERVLVDEGVRVVTNARVTGVSHGPGGFTMDLEADGTLSGSALLVATGRRPDLAAAGLEAIGADPAARALPVDERMRVRPGVWAVGDVTGRGAFTHVAVYQAAIAARDILGIDGPPADYRALPRVTFTDPEIGSVGLSEAAAREAGLVVRVGTSEIPASTRGWIHHAGNEGVVKVVEDAERHVLVGALSVGPVGGEVLGLLSLAVHAAVPTPLLGSMIYAYPTFHRAIEAALADLS